MSAIETVMDKLKSQIGTEVGVSNWITVDQKTIDAFAEVTHDDQWIHIDPERAAKETPFGGAIAHGFLSLSLASRFAYDCFQVEPGQVMGINYGFNKLRFLSPVKAGSRLRGRFVLTSADQRNATQILRETQLTVEIEGSDRPALIADWLGMMVFSEES